MQKNLDKMLEFYSSVSGLPFFILIGMSLVALLALMAMFRQARVLGRLKSELEWQHEQTGKRLLALQTALSQIEGPAQEQAEISVNLDGVVEKIRPDIAALERQIEAMRADLGRLTEVMTEQEQLSRAIEMAKRGARRAEIVEATGVSADQADAIVKFHGPERG
jgi:septal ring factor EnvC (AmiA/AmiB activator)